MTDNEIKDILVEFVECGIVEHKIASVDFIKSVLDLINRLKADKDYYKKNRDKYQNNVMFLSKQCDGLQAENKRLSTLAELGNTRANDYRVMRDRALKAEAENERLEAELEKSKVANSLFSMYVQTRDEVITEAKAEAYKEFAELLHCQCESIINQPHNENVRPISWKVAYEEFDEKIDNTLKELVGE